MKQKLQHLQTQLAHGFVGRDEIIKSALLSVVAGENLLLIGPPGTGKSMVARRVSQALKTEQTPPYFEYLLTKFSTPEEIFGTLSISELKQDRFKRNTQGYLPTVKIAFLDEIFKASSSILNALLTILNERKFHNGTITEDVPLQSLIGASNELPLGQTELSALYDRFLIRRFVDYIDESSLSALFDLPNATTIQDKERLTVQELKEIQQNAKNVEFPHDVQSAILEIWKKLKEAFKENSDEQFSDRRFVKLIHLMRISAVTNGRNQVDFSDVLLLKDCVWDNPDNIEQCLTIIKSVLEQYNDVLNFNSTHITKNNRDKVNTTLDILKASSQQKQPNKNIIKGLKGSGTEQDPFLIEDDKQFLRLSDENIGQQGYYFKQTNNISLNEYTTWNPINLFIGHYDGDNYNISFYKHLWASSNCEFSLFHKIKNSSIKNLNLDSIALSINIQDSSLIKCRADIAIILDKSINCQIYHCITLGQIAKFLESCHVQYCSFGTKIYNDRHRENYFLQSVSNSIIQDCVVDIYIDNYQNFGGLAQEIYSSTIERCFVYGEVWWRSVSSNKAKLSAITITSKDSSIKSCAVGYVRFRTGDAVWNPRIVNDMENTVLQYNVSIDDNRIQNGDPYSNYHDMLAYGTDANSKNGLSISKAQFVQYYFEYTLGWDFDLIWEWNEADNHGYPYLNLREDITINITQQITEEPEEIITQNPEESLLYQQFKANIWL